MRRIATVSELISAYGGTDDASEWFAVGPSCLSNWKNPIVGIPTGWHLRVFIHAHVEGWKLSPTVFNMKEWPDDFKVVLADLDKSQQPEPAE